MSQNQNNPSRPPIPPALVIVFGILAVSTASIFIRYAQKEAPSLVIAAWRLTIATLVLLPAAFLKKRAELRSLLPKEWALALLSGVFLSLHFATWITSLEYTTVASSVVLVSTTPLWVALLSPFALKERVGRMLLLGMLLALLGGVIVGLSDTCTWTAGRLACPPLSEFVQGKAFLGDLLALAGAIAGASYLMIGRRLRARISLISYVFVVYGMAAVCLLLIMLAAGQSPFGYSPTTFLWFILLALVPQLLGHSTFNWALGYLSAAYVSITLLGEPIGSTVLAYFLLSETPSLIKVIGGILILVGIYVASIQDSKKPASETRPSLPDNPG
jgi:drug/metabolite transporter (DMT)-like permease